MNFLTRATLSAFFALAMVSATRAQAQEPASAARPQANDFYFLQQQADAGDAQAQFALGNLYFRGRGVALDYTQALIWYRRSADQNFAPNHDITVTDQTPPSFILQAEDDPVHVENSTVYFLALKNAKVPAEMHLYAEGGHGYGLRPTELPVTHWPKLVETWLHTIKMLPNSAQ